MDRTVPSPNFDERAFGPPDMLVLHYTGMRDGASAIERLRDPDARVSAHYVVEEDGGIVQMVSEAKRAWHAGAGSWMGRRDVNSRSIGIEVVNPGHANSYRPFPPRQIARLIDLCRECVARWSIPAHFVIAHSDMAPDRKQDPGELFPWDQLFLSGIGLHVAAAPIGGGRYLSLGDRGEPVAAYQALLQTAGFGLDPSGLFDEATRLATVAFQRRQRPERIDGVADVSTIDTLHRFAKATMSSIGDASSSRTTTIPS